MAIGFVMPKFIAFLKKRINFTCPRSSTVIVWLIGILLMTALTIRDFVPLLNDYTENNLGSDLRVITDENISRPNITLCIPYYSKTLENIAQSASGGPCPECDGLQSHFWDLWTFFDSN